MPTDAKFSAQSSNSLKTYPMKSTCTQFILLLALLAPSRSPGQAPFIYSMGSNLNLEAAYRIIPTPDSNYLFVGFVADDGQKPWIFISTPLCPLFPSPRHSIGSANRLNSVGHSRWLTSKLNISMN